MRGDPYQVLRNPTHTPSRAFVAASPHHHAHSHAHLTAQSEALWPVPVGEIRTTASVTPRGYVLVAVPPEKVARAQARRRAAKATKKAAPQTGGRLGNGKGTGMGAATELPASPRASDGVGEEPRSALPLYMRRMYAAVFRGAVMYLFPSEKACRAFFRGSTSEDQACGYLDLEGVVSMRRTRIEIPMRSYRPASSGMNSEEQAGDGGGVDGTATSTTRLVDSDGHGGGDSSHQPRPQSATSARTSNSGVSMQSEDAMRAIALPTSFEGIEMSTPHQTWTFFPDWRPLRDEAIEKVRSEMRSAQHG